ncbi:hypothetical protein [Streptomyces xanthochromogenes]
MILTAGAAWAALIGHDLAAHNVPLGPLGVSVTAVLLTAVHFAERFRRSQTYTFRCPTPACTVSISATNTNLDELARLQKLAISHDQHGTAATR